MSWSLELAGNEINHMFRGTIVSATIKLYPPSQVSGTNLDVSVTHRQKYISSTESLIKGKKNPLIHDVAVCKLIILLPPNEEEKKTKKTTKSQSKTSNQIIQ